MNYLHENELYKSKNFDENEDSHLGKNLLKTFKRYENDINQIELVTGAKETHGSVRIRSIRMAEALKARCIKKGDVILLCADNHNDICIPYIASLYIGAVPLGLTTNMKHIEYKNILLMGKPKIVFADPIAIPVLKKVFIDIECDAEIVSFGNETIEDCALFSEFIIETGTEENFSCEDFDPKTTMGLLVCSSGTTGMPKLVAHTHYSLFFALYLTRKHMTEEERRDSIFLTFSPLYWISGSINMMSSCLLAYTRIQSIRPFSPEDFHKACQLYKPTITISNQLALSVIVNYVDTHAIDITNFKMIYIGGSPTSYDLIEKFMKIAPDCKIVLIYGCTEIYFASSDTSYKRDTCGKPLSFIQWKIVDLETEQKLGPYQKGELRVKTPIMFMGYNNNPEATAKAFDNDGWYKTGDLMFYDDEEYFHYVERIKQLIKYRNYQVNAIEIENIINNVSGVAASAVVGLPHFEDGEHPMAFVELLPGANVSIDDIKNTVKDHLSDCKQLRGGVLFIDKIPVTYSGKINRKTIDDMKKKYIITNQKNQID